MATKSTKSTKYSDLKNQAASLQAQAEEARKRETVAVIQQMKSEIQEYGLTPSDLFGSASAGTSQKAAAANGANGAAHAANGKAAPKATRRTGINAIAGDKTARADAYRDSEGNTWGGRGPRPLWLRNALAAGKSLDEFRA